MNDNLSVWLFITVIVIIFLTPTWISLFKGNSKLFTLGIFIANVTIATTPLWLAVLFAAMYGSRPRYRR